MSVKGIANLSGVFGCVDVKWADLGKDPSSGKVPWVFDRPFLDFRRLDPLSRFVCLAVEAIGEEFPTRTALLLATSAGCLHADRKFAASLETIPAAGVFPYTLPSTCLGDVAIRHELVGPVLCLTTPHPEEALDEARLLLDMGEAEAAIVCTGDVVPPEHAHIEAVLLS